MKFPGANIDIMFNMQNIFVKNLFIMQNILCKISLFKGYLFILLNTLGTKLFSM